MKYNIDRHIVSVKSCGDNVLTMLMVMIICSENGDEGNDVGNNDG
jgi:hypothetical protein